MTTRILIVEDDRDLNRLLELDLKRHGYEVFCALNGTNGIKLYEAADPDLIILDVALPDMSGLDVCSALRERSDVPILMMSAHAITEEDIAEGLNIGADEYMVKPLGNLEFHARVKALLRRANVGEYNRQAPTQYEDEYLSVDLHARRVRVDDREIRLTPTEFNLLATFVQNSGLVLTFQQILEQVWGVEYQNEHHYPRIYVSHLRRKIEPDFKNPTYIHNEYGVGYRFVPRSA